MRTTEPELTDRAARLAAMLEPTEVGPDEYVGVSGNNDLPHIFGGLVLAQGLIAAGRTVAGLAADSAVKSASSGKTAHSLHAYFLRAGDPNEPVRYRVERVRDGRRFSVRSVSARQRGGVIAILTTSFADTAGGFGHQRQPPVTVPVDQVSPFDATQAWGGQGASWDAFHVLEVRVDPRHVKPDDTDLRAGDVSLWTDDVWQRLPGVLPADQLVHQAVLVFASDVMLLAAALVPHGIPLGSDDGAEAAWDGVSLDHAVWFHRPIRATDWLLFQQYSPVGAASRAFTRTEIFTEAGELVASVAQEGLIAAQSDQPNPAVTTPAAS